MTDEVRFFYLGAFIAALTSLGFAVALALGSLTVSNALGFWIFLGASELSRRTAERLQKRDAPPAS